MADFQVRILLGRPNRSTVRRDAGSEHRVLLWGCGCSAIEVSRCRYNVMPCADDVQTLGCIAEDDERAHYDAFALSDRTRVDASH